MFTIYERPRDYPDGYVVRAADITAGTVTHDRAAPTAPTLAEARALVPPGLMRFERHPEDDAVIVETWL